MDPAVISQLYPCPVTNVGEREIFGLSNPNSAGKSTTMKVIMMLGDYENSAFIEAYIESYMRGVLVIAQAANGSTELRDRFSANYEVNLDVNTNLPPRNERTFLHRPCKSRSYSANLPHHYDSNVLRLPA